MKIQIINTNYIFDHKLFRLWKFPVLFYGIMLVFKTSSGLKELQNYEHSLEIISNSIIYSGFLLFLLNQFVFSKIGELIIDKDKMTVKKYNGKEQDIDLHSLEMVRIGNDKGKFYSVQLNDNEFELILNKTELQEFMKLLTQKNIEIKNKYWFDRILNWFDLRKNGA